MQKVVCDANCSGLGPECLKRCGEKAQPRLFRTAEQECAVAFCQVGDGPPKSLGETCLLADQHCEFDLDAPKQGTRCADGLRCTVQFDGDKVGRCLRPGAKFETAELIDTAAPEHSVAPVSRWAGVFLGRKRGGCPAGQTPGKVCIRPPAEMVSAERITDLGNADAPMCLYICRPNFN